MNTIKRNFELIAVTSIIVGAGLLAGCQKSDDPEDPQSDCDLVVYGKIFTADPSEFIAEAFVVKEGKFVYVGTKDEAAKYVGVGTKVIDYTGKGLVIPGCTEGHGHFIGVEGVTKMLPGFKATKVASTWFEGKQVYPKP